MTQPDFGNLKDFKEKSIKFFRDKDHAEIARFWFRGGYVILEFDTSDHFISSTVIQNYVDIHGFGLCLLGNNSELSQKQNRLHVAIDPTEELLEMFDEADQSEK